MRNAKEIAGAGDDDEEVVAKHDEPWRDVTCKPRTASSLHDVERRRDEHVTAKCEDDSGRMQWTQPAEGRPGQIEVERGERQLQRDDQADRESRDAPEYRGNRREFDGTHIVIWLAVDRQRWRSNRAFVVAVDDGKYRRDAGCAEQVGVERVFRRVCFGRDDDR